MGEVKSKEQMIHEAAIQIMQEVGVEVHSEKAREIFASHGVRVDGKNVHLTEEQVWHWVKKAPTTFTIYADDPQYNLDLSEGNVYAAPAYGCAFLLEHDGVTITPGSRKAFLKFIRLLHGLDEYSINGGPVVAMSDVDSETANVDMFYATLLNSDKARLITPGTRESVEGFMKVGEYLYGGPEAFAEKARMFMLISTNSPLILDERMCENLIIMAEHGQAVILCPASMLGATSSVTIAGTLASNTAEVLTGICLAEMVRPGTPAVFGIQSTALDMKNVDFACAAPEGMVMQGFGADLARFYGLPSRGGGCQTDSPINNIQGGYESALTFYSAYTHGINLVLIAGGILDSCNLASFDKLLIDAEIIHQVHRACEPFEINEYTLNMDEIKECGHTADFMNCDKTLDDYMELYSPRIGTRARKMNDEMFKETLEKRMEEVLAKAEKTCPVYEKEKLDTIKSILNEACGISIEQLAELETM